VECAQGAKGVLGKYKAEPAHKLKGTQQMYTDLVNAQVKHPTLQSSPLARTSRPPRAAP